MAINISNSASAQPAPQDPLGNPATSPGAGAQSGVGAPAVAAAAPSDQVSAHPGLLALAGGSALGATGNLVTSDLDGEGARLQALQVQQQLSGQSASIANQAPQALLALLR